MLASIRLETGAGILQDHKSRIDANLEEEQDAGLRRVHPYRRGVAGHCGIWRPGGLVGAPAATVDGPGTLADRISSDSRRY